MRVLALDTTSAFGSIALLEDEQILEEVPLHSPDGFSQTLFGYLQRLLSRHQWPVCTVDCFAAAAGPGAFTGIRVGLAAVKGLAEATGRRAVGVSNLRALAACGSTEVRAVVADARRGEVYGAVYSRDGRVVSPEVVAPFGTWLRSLPANITEVLSPDFSPFRMSFDLPIPVVEQRVVAGAIARIAREMALAGDPLNPASVDANYVRRSDAELNWKDHA